MPGSIALCFSLQASFSSGGQAGGGGQEEVREVCQKVNNLIRV
jgi:hypothetical protein